MMEGVNDDKSIQFIGFGTFSIGKCAAPIGITPRTHAKLQILASKMVNFNGGSKLKSLASWLIS
jgi:nucleoid DNA-binding protein